MPDPGPRRVNLKVDVSTYCCRDAESTEDGKALVSFDDAATVARRITDAQEVYGLSPAQVRLARLIVDGHDLAASADLLAVSINTLRTQLQRIFDKTGVRSQAALVRSLLSADAPNK